MKKDTPFKEDLKNIRGSVRKTKRNGLRDPLPPTHAIGADGVDHINIWEKGVSDLGVFLAHGSSFPFRHPVFSIFNSVECFWHYIRSEERDDRIRSMKSLKAKKFGTRMKPVNVPNFYAVIMDANWQKVKQYPEMAQMLKDSTLPLDMYYVHRRKGDKHAGLRIRPVFAHWVLKGFEEIRKALKENREPDFSPLMRQPTDDLYAPLLHPLDNGEATEKKKASEDKGGKQEPAQKQPQEASETEPMSELDRELAEAFKDSEQETG